MGLICQAALFALAQPPFNREWLGFFQCLQYRPPQICDNRTLLEAESQQPHLIVGHSLHEVLY